jgi:hypothetical protein
VSFDELLARGADSGLEVHHDDHARTVFFGHITEEGMAVLDKIAAAGVAPGDGGYPEDGAPAMTTIIERAKRTGAGAAGA